MLAASTLLSCCYQIASGPRNYSLGSSLIDPKIKENSVPPHAAAMPQLVLLLAKIQGGAIGDQIAASNEIAIVSKAVTT